MLKKYIYILPVLFIFFSCSILKKNEISADKKEKEEMNFVYLFHEANKNRLKGNLRQAEQEYIAATEINPESAASYFYLAGIRIAEKDYISALNYSEKAIKINPNNYWYLLEKADLLNITDNKKEAENIYYQLINKSPKNEIPYIKLTNIYKNNKDIEKLIYVYELKQQKNEYSADTDVQLFNLYLKNKNYKKAENVILRLRKNNPYDYKYSGMAAEYYYSMNNKEKAEKIYESLLIKHPDNTQINLSYAYFCRKTGKKEEYFKVVKKLINSDLELIKKINLLISGKYPNFPPEQYKILLDDLYKKHPEELLVNTLFAEYYLNNNNEKNAIPYIKKSLELNPSDFNMAIMLFSILYDVRDFELLNKQTEKYTEFFPNRPKIYLYKGISEYELKDYNQAEKTLNSGKNLVIDDNELTNQFIYYLSLTYKKKKEIKKSAELAQELLNDKNIKIFEHYGDLLFLENKKDEAVEYWKKALENGNKNPELIYKIKNFNKLTTDDIIK